MYAATRVINSKVVRTLIESGGKRRMYTVGIRVDMADGSWWMFSRKHRTWTKHEPGLPITYKSGSPVLTESGMVERTPERVTSYGNQHSLERSMQHCPALLAALSDGLMLAA